MSACFFRSAAIETTAKCFVVAMACAIPLSVAVTTGLSIALLVCCTVSMTTEKLVQGFRHPVTIALLILLGLYLLSSVYTVGSTKELQQSLRKVARVLYFPLISPLFSVVRWRRWALLAYLAALIFSVVATIIISINPTPIFKDSIFTSLFVAYAIFMLSHFFIEYPRYKWLSAALVIFLSYYLFFLNYGRTGQFLFFVLYLIFFAQRFKSKIKNQVIAALTMVLIAVFAILLPTSFSTRSSIAKYELQHYIDSKHKVMPHTSSVGLRLMMAHNSWELIKQKPFFGWGAGSFKQAYSQFVSYENIDKQEERSNPHNQYLLTAVELGIFGLLALLYLFYILMREFLRSRSLENYLGFGLVCAIAIGCFANSWLLDFTSMFFFVLFAAVLASANIARI